jgi:hypothetical protein
MNMEKNEIREDLIREINGLKNLARESIVEVEDYPKTFEHYAAFKHMLNYLEEYVQEKPDIQKLEEERKRVTVCMQGVLDELSGLQVPKEVKDRHGLRDELQALNSFAFDSIFGRKVDNEIIKNLRDVGDNPARIFELMLAFLKEYVKEWACGGYLNGKRQLVLTWMEEAEKFGYKPREVRVKA